MARVLVTGGAGFIGSHIVAALVPEHEVLVFDDLSTGRPANLDGLSCTLVRGDVRQTEAVRTACEGMEVVFHLAAQISVPASMERPVETVEVNTIGTLNVIDACIQRKVRALVFSSSAAIYGNDPELPKRESMTPDPRSPYAVSKLDGEYYLQSLAAPAGVHAVALRYFNVFGPRQDPRSSYAAAIPAFVSRALAGEPLTLHGDGEQTRDFVYVEDVARANLRAAGLLGALPPETGGGVFNIGGGDSVTIRELAEEIVRLAGSSSRIGHGPARAGDVRHSRADVSRARELLGFAPRASLADGLRVTIDAFRRS